MANYLGVDSSTAATGWGVIDEAGVLVDWGVIKPSKTKLNLQQQYALQYRTLEEVALKHNVRGILCEDQHGGLNKDTLKKLSRVSGIVGLLAGMYDLPFDYIHPSSWRKQVMGRGNADKKDAVDWANETFGLSLTIKQNDIAEGIGIAHAAVSHFTGELNNGDTGTQAG